MGAQMSRRMIVLAGIQTARGLAAVISDSNAMRVDADVDYSPQSEKITRNLALPTFSKEGDGVGAKWQTLTFKHEAAGAGLGANGVPNLPLYDCLLQACGLVRRTVHLLFREGTSHTFQKGETVTGGVSLTTGTIRYIFDDILVVEAASGVAFQADETITGGTSTATAVLASAAKALEYMPVTARIENQKCATLHYHKDGVLKAMVDGRGTFSLDCPGGNVAKFSFTMTGPWVDPADAVLPTPVLPEFAAPVFVAAQVKLGNYVPKLVNVKVDLGNVIKARPDANAPEGIVEHFISDRNVTGSLDPEVDALAEYNPYQLWKLGTPSGLRFQVGQLPGYRLLGLIPKLRKTDMKETDRDGIAAYNESFQATRDTAGDDELRFYFF